MINKTVLFVILILGFQGVSQQGNIDNLVAHYTEYYELAPETLFVQLNKTQFIPGENVWFKAYVYDTKTQSPYLKTTNLYASVFNCRGHLMEQKLCHVQEAMTNGDFDIKANYPPGEYLIKFSTNWMKNFNEDLAVYQSFVILGEETEKDLAPETKSIKDIQFFPEGGHFISNVMNTVGFKLNDSKGNSIKILSAKILDSKATVVANFSSNDLGLGKLQILPKANETYTVEAKLRDGSTITQAFLQPELRGVAVTVNNLNDEQLFIGLATNKSTLPELLGKNFYLLIHRDGAIKKIDFKFESNVYQYTIPVSRARLFSGVNILTFFNEQNQPIVERLIFNRSKNLKQSVEITTMSKRVDSTKIVLKTTSPSEATISVSALPVANESYNTNNTIFNSFLLKPYVKGSIDNASYYFEHEDRKTIYDLDLLLLVQGWSKHDWKDIFYSPQQALYNFETGFQVVGKLTDAQQDDLKEIQIFSHRDALMEKSKIDKSGYFKFEELRLSDSTKISFSAKNDKDKMIKPKVYFNIFPKAHQDSISKEEVDVFLKQLNTSPSTIDYSGYITDPFKLANMVSLDTVSLKNKKKDVRTKIKYGKAGGKFIDLERGFNTFTRVLDVISYNGFNVSEGGFGGDVSIRSRRTVGIRAFATPLVYINNVETINLNDLQYLTLNEVEDLYISQSASITGTTNGFGGTINIFLKQNFYSKNSGASNYNSSQINLGFSKAKTYYTPNYDTSNPELLSTYAAVAWLPNLKADHNGQFEFNMVNYNYGDVQLYISGMAEDGSLISEIIALDKNQSAK